MPVEQPLAPAIGALQGIKVIELGRVLAAPWAAQMLGDLGADVIKVERPVVGDEARHHSAPVRRADGSRSQEGATYLSANRNKRSVTANLAAADGQEILRQLVETADVLIENFVPGKLAEYGLDYPSLSALNPRLIYCSLSGYGHSGPYRDRAGYDPLFQAHGGMMAVTGEPDDVPGGGPMKTGPALVDVAAGCNAVIGILAALRARDLLTGKGQHIDIALMDSAVAMQSHYAQAYLNTGEQPARTGTSGIGSYPSRVFPTADGHIYLLAITHRDHDALSDALGLPDLKRDARFATARDRYDHRDAWDAAICPALATLRTRDLQSMLDAAGVPNSPVNSYGDVFKDPQVIHRQLVETMPHPLTADKNVRLLSNPVRLSETPPVARLRPPLLGEHTDTVLTDLGYPPERIAVLRAAGDI